MARFVAGRLNGISAPVGTILGPRGLTREYLAVIDVDDGGVSVGYATSPEIEAAMHRDEPQSVTEARDFTRWHRGTQ